MEFLAELVPPSAWLLVVCASAVLLPVWAVAAGLRRTLPGARDRTG